MKELKKLLEKIAKEEKDVDNIFEASGGNYDDAYSIGMANGRASLAKEILDDFLLYDN